MRTFLPLVDEPFGLEVDVADAQTMAGSPAKAYSMPIIVCLVAG